MNSQHVLTVTKDPMMGQMLVELLENNLNCHTEAVSNFENALDQLITNRYSVALTEISLGTMSGIDLLAVVTALHLNTGVILIDDNIKAKSAIAALRLGAVDYLSKPLNLELVLLRAGLELSQRATTPPPEESAETITRKRQAWINPVTRPAAFILRRPQFLQIEGILTGLQQQTKATFAGLVDSVHNIVSAAGDLVHSDLIVLKQVLSQDYGTSRLANVLQEKSFTTSYLEGEHRSIYITNFGARHPVSLVLICPVTTKQGIVWYCSKHAALGIESVLNKVDQPHRELVFAP